MSSVNCLSELFRNCSLNNHNMSHNRKQETLKYQSTEIRFMVCGFNLAFDGAFLLHGLLISVQPPLVDFADLSVKVVENAGALEARYGHNTSDNLQPARGAVNKERGSLLYKPEWFESDLRVYPPAAKHTEVDLAARWIPPLRVSHNSCRLGFVMRVWQIVYLLIYRK